MRRSNLPCRDNSYCLQSFTSYFIETGSPLVEGTTTTTDTVRSMQDMQHFTYQENKLAMESASSSLKENDEEVNYSDVTFKRNMTNDARKKQDKRCTKEA